MPLYCRVGLRAGELATHTHAHTHTHIHTYTHTHTLWEMSDDGDGEREVSFTPLVCLCGFLSPLAWVVSPGYTTVIEMCERALNDEFLKENKGKRKTT